MILHFPTLMLLIGYAIFWLELYLPLGPSPGRTSWLATALAFIGLSVILWKNRQFFVNLHTEGIGFWRGSRPTIRWVFVILSLFLLMILAISFTAALLPPHLMQEGDALNYHYTLPRQHLILHSFAHLPWSVADLFMLPVQFGLSPYWFCTSLPNKIPQFLFLLGLWGLTTRIAYRISGRSLKSAFFALAALAGSHGFAIQYGTAMMDIPLCYLFLAAVDSFLEGRSFWCAVEASFFIWAKFPVMYLGIFSMALIGIGFLRWTGWKVTAGFVSKLLFHPMSWKLLVAQSMAASLLIAGPFCAKSLYYTGGPQFPFGVGLFTKLIGEHHRDLRPIQEAARVLWGTVGSKANGLGLKAFAEHFFLLAVPMRGVNNIFDYPMGLPYLLCFAPFLAAAVGALRRRQAPVLAFLVLILWAAWWATSHQARFLYVPVALIFVTTAGWPRSTASKGLWVGLLVSAALTTVSLWRAYGSDIGKSGIAVLRPEDRFLLEKNREFGVSPMQIREWPDKEMAFATFPVYIRHGDALFIMPSS